MLSLTDRWMYARAMKREIWARESGLLCIGEKAARVWGEEHNNRPKRSSGGMVRCDAMRREQNEMRKSG